jgi:hypothetical protein
MKSPYATDQLDALLAACIEFTDQYDQYFNPTLIDCQRVGTDIDGVRRMMEWTAEMDKGILEYAGLGLHNIAYFRLGHHARRLVTEGGFKQYFRRKEMLGYLEQVKAWVPISVSLLALVVSVLSWRGRDNSAPRVDALSVRVSDLQVRQAQMTGTVAALRSSVDTIALRIRNVRTARR